MKTRRSKQMFLSFLAVAIATLACNQVMGLPFIPTQQSPTESVSITPDSTGLPEEPVDPGAGSSGLGDSLYPGFGNGGYDALHYTLDITVNDIATSDLSAVTTIDAKATQDLNSFNLDFIGFEITSIKINEQSAVFERDGQELTVAPSIPLAVARQLRR